MDEYEFQLKRQRGETLHAAVVRLCKWIPIAFMCYVAYLSIAALAGKSTLAAFGIYLVSDLKVNKFLSHIVMAAFGIGGTSYGYAQKRLQQRNIERMSSVIQELENKLDPSRSSSRLTAKGLTRPEDEI
jgi:p-aminobenzoyl-glutamate transporter AbgT